MFPRPTLAFLSLALLAAAAMAQGPDPALWLRSTFPDLQKVDARTVLAAARAAGLTATAAGTLAFKQVYYALRSKDRRALPNHRRWDWSTPVLPAARPELVAVETEHNDGWQWADDIGSQTSATGSIAATHDIDTWRFVALGQFYTFSVQATGPTPITDSILTVRNANGEPLAFNDDSGAGLMSAISIYLPAGICYLEVGSYSGTSGGTYDLVIQADPTTLTPLTSAGATGTTRLPGSPLAHDVFTFTVPEGRLGLLVNSTGQDTALLVQRADGCILFVNDDSTAGGLDGAADIDLPAGSYTAYVVDLAGLGGLPFTLAMQHTPGSFPLLCQNPALTGSLAGDESLRLYRAALGNPQRIDLRTDPGPLAPVGDTVLAYYDPDLDLVCDVDDDDPAGTPGHGFYSRLVLDLPASAGLVGVTPYPGSVGDYSLATACNLPFTAAGTAGFGSNAVSYAGFGFINVYPFDNCTQVTTRFRSDSYWYAVLDGAGNLADCWYGSDVYPQAGELPAGQLYLLTWDRYDYSGPIRVDILPALATEGTSLFSYAKAGDFTVLLGAFTTVSGVNLGIGDRGFFCLPLGGPVLVTLGLQPIPAAGRVFWLNRPPVQVGVYLQAGDLHTGTSWTPGPLGTWRNLLRL